MARNSGVGAADERNRRRLRIIYKEQGQIIPLGWEEGGKRNTKKQKRNETKQKKDDGGKGGGRRKIHNQKIGRWSRERDLSGSRQREDLLRAGSGARRTLQWVGEPQRKRREKSWSKGAGTESETGRQ
jgi:hypothetical protein